MKKNVDYIVIPELPIQQQAPLCKWLSGQTVPIVEEEGENKDKCCYIWDYKQWFEHWEKNRIAPVIDW